MTVLHRSAGPVLAAAVLGLALLGAAPAAQATDITNPADHPAPITLTIDGQTYRDGADTLPGYDDYACTPIPNVQYDFADDEIQYYDGGGDLIQTAHWTEWDRISSYQTWVTQQQQAAGSPSNGQTPGSGTTTPAATTPAATGQAPTSAATTGPAATGPAATNPATTSPATRTTSSATKTAGTKTRSTATKPKTTSAATKTTTSAVKTKGSKTKTTSHSSAPRTAASTPKKAAAPHAGKQHGTPAKHSAATRRPAGAAPTDAGTTPAAPAAASGAPAAGATTTAQGAAAPASTPSAAAAPKYKLVSDHTGAGGGMGDTRPVGVGILVAVFALAGVVFLYGFGRRGARGRFS